jgi:predicted DNA-binding protein
MSFDDREKLKAIAEASKAKDYRLRDIIEAFILSDLFQSR